MAEKKIILVVDDDALTRNTLSRILTKEGYEVVEAVDGKEGLQKYHESPPALIICDRLMPGINGIGMLKRLREAGNMQTPFVFLTALTEPKDKEAVKYLHVTDYLDKPIDPETLRACVKRVLGSALKEKPDAHEAPG